jgi:hypothetical protein
MSFVVNFYNAGVVTRDRRIGSWTQSYDLQRCKFLLCHG